MTEAKTAIIAVFCTYATEYEMVEGLKVMTAAVQRLCGNHPDTHFEICVFGPLLHDSEFSQAESFESAFWSLDPRVQNASVKKIERADGLRGQVGALFERRKGETQTYVVCDCHEEQIVCYELSRYFAHDMRQDLVQIHCQPLQSKGAGSGEIANILHVIGAKTQLRLLYVRDNCPSVYVEIARTILEAYVWLKERLRVHR